MRNAVRELRTRLGDTQQAFAARTGLAISTVVRYELSRAPSGNALALFERLASENGHQDIAAVFRRAALEGVVVPPMYKSAILALIDTLSLPGLESDRTKILSVLENRIRLYEKTSSV